MHRRSLLTASVAGLAGLAGCLQTGFFGDDEEDEDDGVPGFDEEAFEDAMAEEDLEARFSMGYEFFLYLTYETDAESTADHEEEAELVVSHLVAAIEDDGAFERGVDTVYATAEGPGAGNEFSFDVRGPWLLEIRDDESSVASVTERAIEQADDLAVDVDGFDAAVAVAEMEDAGLTGPTFADEEDALRLEYGSPGESQADLELDVEAVVAALASGIEDPEAFDQDVPIVLVTGHGQGQESIQYNMQTGWLVDVHEDDRSAEAVAEDALMTLS